MPQNANRGSIPSLDMPVMNAALGALADATDLGAVPDDGKSDRRAIQDALDSVSRVGIHFLPGEYLVEEPLYWNRSWRSGPPGRKLARKYHRLLSVIGWSAEPEALAAGL